MRRSEALERLLDHVLEIGELPAAKHDKDIPVGHFRRLFEEWGHRLLDRAQDVVTSEDDRPRPALILNRLKPPSSRLNWFPFVEYGDTTSFTSYERLIQRDSSRQCVWVAPWWIAWFYRLIPGIWWCFDPKEDGLGENGFVNWAIAWPHGLQIAYVSRARWPGKGPYVAFSWVARRIENYRRVELSLPW